MNFNDILKVIIQENIKGEFNIDMDLQIINVERPNKESWGDYSSNVCLMLAKELKQPPLEIAKSLCYRMQDKNYKFRFNEIEHNIAEKITFEHPGFVNFRISDLALLLQGEMQLNFLGNDRQFNSLGLLRGHNVLFEYTDPNPFKVFHIGHLMSNAIGESLSRIFQFLGASVKRANYQGDVGMHIAKSIWGALKNMTDNNIELFDLENMSLEERMSFFGKSYSLGATMFEEEPKCAEEMKQINTMVYLISQKQLQDNEGWNPIINYDKNFKLNLDDSEISKVEKLYVLGRRWSLEEFEILYKKLGTNFDFYFFESKVGEYGYKIVNEGLNSGIFEKDNGAVIFKGEKYGLHTRVFINSLGFPVYEAKDLGLAFLKNETFKFDKSYIVTANEIDEYFKVVLKAMELIDPVLSSKTIHVGHGVMKFKEGKMSSRKGDVITGKTLLESAKQEILIQMKLSNSTSSEEEMDYISDKLSVSAVKYSILKHNPQRDIIYDEKMAVSVTGNTGPYIQYTHARTVSILEKMEDADLDFTAMLDSLVEYTKEYSLKEQETSILRHLFHFEEMVVRSYNELSPSIVSEYLFELAQRYNSMYNDLSILSADTQEQKNIRLFITKKVQKTMKDGLWLLGLEALNKV